MFLIEEFKIVSVLLDSVLIGYLFTTVNDM